MQAKGAATPTHSFNRFWDIAMRILEAIERIEAKLGARSHLARLLLAPLTTKAEIVTSFVSKDPF
jgi:hypothetical protein